MVERRKRRFAAERQSQRQSQRPKRRRLNPHPSPNTTPARTSHRLSRKSPTGQGVPSIKWEKELPNATEALDRALSKLQARGEVETRDLCDEIADYLTPALFEDIWRCEQAQALVQEHNSGRVVGSSSTAEKAEEAERSQDRENIEPNVEDADRYRKVHSLPKPVPVPQVVIVDPDTPSSSTMRRKPLKRKKEKSTPQPEPREKGKGDKNGVAVDKGGSARAKAGKKTPAQKGKRPDEDLEEPQFGVCNGGLVEEIVEIEEAFVDGGIASLPDQNKTLLGDVEEHELDCSGSKSVPNSEVKNATPRTGLSRRKRRKEALLGDVEEQVLDRSGSTSVPNSELKNASPSVDVTRRLPWWCVSDDILQEIPRSEKEVLRSYVATIIRTCARESWNAETLREGYRRDPSSNRGKAFRAVHSSLQLFERARHMKECETKWRPELLRELLQRQEVGWSVVKHDKKFDQFAGCDACLGNRRATARIWLKGKRYDASDFWPGTSRFRVLSSEQVSNRKLSVSAELRNGTTNDHLIRIGANENDAEFWVDSHCLRKCLLFHELVHSTATIARDFRGFIERELGNGKIELKWSSKESTGNGGSVSDRLERHLLRSVLNDKEYLRNHVDHLTDIIRLGDVYFSSPDAEVLDSGKPGKSVYVPSIYDAPLDLGHEIPLEYKQSIEEVVARSCRKR